MTFSVRSVMVAQESLTSLEICAGAGGMALGLESAGFAPVALVERDAKTCRTLSTNRPHWNVIQASLEEFEPEDHSEVYDVDLMSAGMPRIKSAATVKRPEDRAERELFRCALYLVGPVQPRAVLFDNVPEMVQSDAFAAEREEIRKELEHLGYRLHWRVLNAKDFGVPQDREHGLMVALKERYADDFAWPESAPEALAVGDVLHASMRTRGWAHADRWRARAQRFAPTLVGGSDRRGGADLGLPGSKAIWRSIGINGNTVANADAQQDRKGRSTPSVQWDLSGKGWGLDMEPEDMPALTVAQAALVQGFPDTWRIQGLKTHAYRQVGQAVPPPLAAAVGRQIARALRGAGVTED
ncbi:DNA cytosine methyltransferase [Streptomyces sp. NPDC058646]|uniref:DNA cytosine methyltransferase n=1 Tax=Streptomyces sp. NPDC058646 TaxID=3346574 RepID=UPI0036539BA6